ncbi:MAG TPA: hypothetical protein VFX21_00175 [Acidimicrobiia bacterium]|nr:hypothetical protein [Acidimicrobiia bacterium]
MSPRSTPPPDHVAAIAAAMAVISAERAAVSADASSPSDRLTMWVEASRRSAQRAGLQRGPWRMSGRISRRLRV